MDKVDVTEEIPHVFLWPFACSFLGKRLGGGFEIPANNLITRDEQITNLCFVCRYVCCAEHCTNPDPDHCD